MSEPKKSEAQNFRKKKFWTPNCFEKKILESKIPKEQFWSSNFPGKKMEPKIRRKKILQPFSEEKGSRKKYFEVKNLQSEESWGRKFQEKIFGIKLH